MFFGISPLVFNLISYLSSLNRCAHSCVIELNTRRELPYIHALMNYYLYHISLLWFLSRHHSHKSYVAQWASDLWVSEMWLLFGNIAFLFYWETSVFQTSQSMFPLERSREQMSCLSTLLDLLASDFGFFNRTLFRTTYLLHLLTPLYLLLNLVCFILIVLQRPFCILTDIKFSFYHYSLKAERRGVQEFRTHGHLKTFTLRRRYWEQV